MYKFTDTGPPLKIKLVVLIAAGACILFGMLASPTHAEERKWTRSEILAIADRATGKSVEDLDKLSVSFDAYNSHWKDFRKGQEDPPKLKGRDYVAVYYAPLVKTLDGDMYVFIDRDTGEALDTMQWG